MLMLLWNLRFIHIKASTGVTIAKTFCGAWSNRGTNVKVHFGGFFFPFYWCKLWKRWFLLYANFSDCGYNAHKQCIGSLKGKNCTPDKKLIKRGMSLFSWCCLICAWPEGGRQTDKQTDRVRVGPLITCRERGWQMLLTRCLVGWEL